MHNNCVLRTLSKISNGYLLDNLIERINLNLTLRFFFGNYSKDSLEKKQSIHSSPGIVWLYQNAYFFIYKTYG